MWKAAPAFVPQVLRNAPPPPPVDTRPAPTATAAAPEEPAKRAGVSLAFKPASVTRKSPKAPGIAAKAPVGGNSGGAALEDTEPKPRGLGFGFATVTSTTEVRIQHQPPVSAAPVGGEDEENQQAAVNAAAGGFFHSSYRDEYNPARPNSYEAFCEERLNRKKLEQVKKELDRRQREQEIEVRRASKWLVARQAAKLRSCVCRHVVLVMQGKRERERLVRDVEAGKAPAADLSAAGRGRGMTVPAWMRKKMCVSSEWGWHLLAYVLTLMVLAVALVVGSQGGDSGTTVRGSESSAECERELSRGPVRRRGASHWTGFCCLKTRRRERFVRASWTRVVHLS